MKLRVDQPNVQTRIIDRSELHVDQNYREAKTKSIPEPQTAQKLRELRYRQTRTTGRLELQIFWACMHTKLLGDHKLDNNLKSSRPQVNQGNRYTSMRQKKTTGSSELHVEVDQDYRQNIDQCTVQRDQKYTKTRATQRPGLHENQIYKQTELQVDQKCF